jgi:acyl-CoA thioesterase
MYLPEVSRIYFSGRKRKEMSMEMIRKLVNGDRFALSNGMELRDVEDGYARTSMKLEKRHLNGVGVAQGGAIFTLADLAFAACCNSHGTIAVAVNVSISFVKAADEGMLFAEAREIAVSPKLSNCTVHVTNEAGELIAIFQGLAYRKKETAEEVVARRETHR